MPTALSLRSEVKPGAAWKLKRLPGESEAELLRRRNEQYFQEQLAENVEWFSRLNLGNDFRGKTVLDLGSGHGALAINIAEAGAAEVLGIDVDAPHVAFAQTILRERYPELRGKVSFAVEDVRAIQSFGRFDYVVSKDSFEHIEDLDQVIASLGRILKPGGRVITGFSPLYYSPFGDHGRLLLPRGLWLHALLPDKLLLQWASFRHGRKFKTFSDLGLNQITPRRFRALFPPSEWRHVSIHYNQGNRFLLSFMRVLRKIPWLEKYFTVSIYAVLERR